MSIKTGKKLGFVASLAMLVGSVVGIGIFFKSHGILRSNDWNGTGTFIAWLIGGILSLSAAVSFSEIGSMKTNRVHGLPAWAEKVGGKRFGYFIRFNYSFFYYGLLSAVLGVFGSEMIFNIITSMSSYSMEDFPVYAHIILGLFFTLFFLATNYLSTKVSGLIASISTILKWIPLVLVALLGVLFATTNNNSVDLTTNPLHGSKYLVGKNAFNNGTSFSFVSMLAALPAVLFAFDAFLGVGSIKSKMEEPKKLPMVVLVGMVSVLILYLFIALSAILHGTGMVSGLPMGLASNFGFGIFDQILDPTQSEIMGKFIVVFITISTFGVINGISAVSIAANEQVVETNTIAGLKTLRGRFGDNKTVLIYSFVITLFWTLVFGIPASILNSDAIVDGISNFPTLFFFGIYGLVILLYTLKRNSFETTKMNKILFNAFAWVAIVGIAFVVGYQLTYGFFINAILHPTERTHWGLYVGDKSGTGVAFPSRWTEAGGIAVEMTLAQASIVMFSMAAMLSSAPYINMFITKKFENNNVIIDTFKDVKIASIKKA